MMQLDGHRDELEFVLICEIEHSSVIRQFAVMIRVNFTWFYIHFCHVSAANPQLRLTRCLHLF